MPGNKVPAVLEKLRESDLFGVLAFRFDPTHGVLVNAVGIPLSRSAAREIRTLVARHLEHSPKVLAQLGNEALAEDMPKMAKENPFPVSAFE